MTPQPYPAPKDTQPPTSSTSLSSSSSSTVTNIVFGLCAVAIGTLTVWQGRKAWHHWHHTQTSYEAEELPDTNLDLDQYQPSTLSTSQAEIVTISGGARDSQDLESSILHNTTEHSSSPAVSSTSATQSMIEAGTGSPAMNNDEEPSLRTGSPLGCRPVLEDPA